MKIAEQGDDVISAVVASMEAWANDPEMQRICAQYMGRIQMPEGARMMEIGCGGGAATRLILQNMNPAELVGVDPSEGLLAHARGIFDANDRVGFQVGDAVDTGAADGAFNVVFAHTVYSHLPDPQAALAEAFRVLRPGRQLVVFDGDYAAITMSLYDGDPMERCVGLILRNMVHAPYIMRQLPDVMQAAGFSAPDSSAYGFVQTSPAEYLVTLIERAMTAAVTAEDITQDLADGYLAEARRRVEEGRFYAGFLFLCHATAKPV